MKTLGKCFVITLFFFSLTILILRVDRQGALMHGFDNSISHTLQVFIENKLILH